MDGLKYEDLTGKIIGCAMEVHKFLGNGFPEVIYQRALAYELEINHLEFARELSMEIFYKDRTEPIGNRRVDFLVRKKILVEIKAVESFTNTHFAQILNYLAAYHLEVGLLINFGERSLKFRRFVLTNHPYQKK